VIHHGDCLDVMPTLEPATFDAIVTDPPYGLGFMGKAWDHGVPGVPFWAEMLRVARPSAYLLSFGGTRTVHRMACAIEDAGWIIRDMLVWGYASGFPKGRANLKPAWEPIVMARKPGPLRPLAIDECRIGTGGDKGEWPSTDRPPSVFADGAKSLTDNASGRWPANIILTDPIFDGGWDGVVGGGDSGRWSAENTYGDSGTPYSRFFLIPKAARSDREPVLGGDGGRVVSVWGGDEDDLTPGKKSTVARRNVHPTVKPTELMRHLVRLVTPQGGTVLDPFLGSGTTALAAEMEGFAWVGIEREAEYVAIAEARLNGTQRGMAL
jgi:hypothetical protein